MRIYIPVLCSDMDDSEISPRIVHCVSADARRAFPSEDEESLEMLATLYAADGAVLLMRGQKNCDGEDQGTAGGRENMPALCLRRIIAVGEAPDAWLEPLNSAEMGDESLAVPTAVRLTHALPWEKIESIHVDEPGNEELVRQAIAGDDQAFEALGDLELLWYDVTEREHLLEELWLCRH